MKRASLLAVLWVGITCFSVGLPSAQEEEWVDYEEVTVADGGSIAGQITFAGEVPPLVMAAVDKDSEVCGTEQMSPTLVIDKATMGISDVVVSIEEIFEGKKWPDAKGTPTLSQKGCVFFPHILIVKAETDIDLINDDGIMHNMHTTPIDNETFNKSQSADTRVLNVSGDYTFEPETIRVKCDVHSWMGAWIVSTEHPYFTVTDEKGNFALNDIPPGQYTFKFWHEVLGSQSKELTIGPKKKQVVNLSFKMKK